jgi:glyceraldehyde-3-phosphate dehydrogenase/erythrose-4-phosphate dehydrogenase
MIQPGLYDDANSKRAEMKIYLSWNNGPFEDAVYQVECHVGKRLVFVVHSRCNAKEMDWPEAIHNVIREATSQVIGHRVTNSHIHNNRVVYGAPYQDEMYDTEIYHPKDY